MDKNIYPSITYNLDLKEKNLNKNPKVNKMIELNQLHLILMLIQIYVIFLIDSLRIPGLMTIFERF